jgi:hypothetical protein
VPFIIYPINWSGLKVGLNIFRICIILKGISPSQKRRASNVNDPEVNISSENDVLGWECRTYRNAGIKAES